MGDLYEEAQPTDSLIPVNWEKTATGWDDAPFGAHHTAGCERWFVVRHLIGPRRWGALTPVGPKLVSAFYKGDCVWEIILHQMGVQREYVLYMEMVVMVERCGATRTETILDVNGKNPSPTWRAVRVRKQFCVYNVLQTVTAKDPGGLPCGEDISFQGVPQQVKDVADAEAERNKATRGMDIPVAPPKPKPKYDGPTIGPITPEEDRRRQREAAEREKLKKELMGEGGEQEHTHAFPGGGEPEPWEPIPEIPVPMGPAD